MPLPSFSSPYSPSFRSLFHRLFRGVPLALSLGELLPGRGLRVLGCPSSWPLLRRLPQLLLDLPLCNALLPWALGANLGQRRLGLSGWLWLL